MNNIYYLTKVLFLIFFAFPSYGLPNTAPSASAVSVSGTLKVGETLTGTYTYNDADGDPQSGSIFKWYRSDDVSGTNKAVISGAEDTIYILATADEGKFISFEVTPHDGTDAGALAASTWEGPVQPPVSVRAHNYTAYLGTDGTATLSPADIDNGSTGYSALFLDPAVFGCTDIGYGTGNEWETLGGVGISVGGTDYHSIATAPDGTVYVAYQDAAGSNKTTVLRWDGSAWSPLGGAGISAGGAYNQSLAAAGGDTVYVAYRDGANGLKATVLRWDGSTWSALGGVGISAGSASNQSLAVAPDGTPYLAYLDIENDYKTTVLRWDGSAWSPLGGAGISVGSAQFQRVAVGPDGTNTPL